MEIKFECTHCGQHISATAEESGVVAQCPACGESLVVPDLQVPVDVDDCNHLATQPTLTPPVRNLLAFGAAERIGGQQPTWQPPARNPLLYPLIGVSLALVASLGALAVTTNRIAFNAPWSRQQAGGQAQGEVKPKAETKTSAVSPAAKGGESETPSKPKVPSEKRLLADRAIAVDRIREINAMLDRLEARAGQLDIEEKQGQQEAGLNLEKWQVLSNIKKEALGELQAAARQLNMEKTALGNQLATIQRQLDQ